ncbi:MAG: transposase [Tannerellaceae bacterium]|jgi:REP element-mobilizing transposase RayT|nr:transposase [Tannerellaceae bacterium]
MLDNPEIHNRRSIRLKGYDYSQAGLYFITICTQNRVCLFGEICRGAPVCAPNVCAPEMILNDAGKMIDKWVIETQNKFSDIEIHDYVIMPNHFHAIIANNGTGNPVGADLRVCPDRECAHAGAPQPPQPPQHIGSPLYSVVQWFKTMTTNEYIRGVKTLNWQPFDKKLWQRNYYEHIIRNDQSYQNISDYILNNPLKWTKDTLFHA